MVRALQRSPSIPRESDQSGSELTQTTLLPVISNPRRVGCSATAVVNTGTNRRGGRSPNRDGAAEAPSSAQEYPTQFYTPLAQSIHDDFSRFAEEAGLSARFRIPQGLHGTFFGSKDRKTLSGIVFYGTAEDDKRAKRDHHDSDHRAGSRLREMSAKGDS